MKQLLIPAYHKSLLVKILTDYRLCHNKWPGKRFFWFTYFRGTWPVKFIGQVTFSLMIYIWYIQHLLLYHIIMKCIEQLSYLETIHDNMSILLIQNTWRKFIWFIEITSKIHFKSTCFVFLSMFSIPVVNSCWHVQFEIDILLLLWKATTNLFSKSLTNS